MKKGVKKLLIGAGAAATGAAAAIGVSKTITHYLVKLAMDRELPGTVKNMEKAKERLVGAPEIQEIVQRMAAAADELRSSGCETVELLARDGEKLIGHWHWCEHAERTIVAMHGWRSSWANDFGRIAPFWHNNYCNVLYAEQRGQGDSGGDYMGFGLLERFDCLDWVNWVNERCGAELPVYLGGVSMGATTVLMTAGLDLPSNVRGIIADCGFTSPYAIWKHVAEHNLHVNYGLRAAAADDLCRKRIQFGAKEYSTVDAMKQCTVPVLFIHGSNDTFVPIDMTYENYIACAAPKHLLIIPGADHGLSYFVEQDKYETAVREFWETYD